MQVYSKRTHLIFLKTTRQHGSRSSTVRQVELLIKQLTLPRHTVLPTTAVLNYHSESCATQCPDVMAFTLRFLFRQQHRFDLSAAGSTHTVFITRHTSVRLS